MHDSSSTSLKKSTCESPALYSPSVLSISKKQEREREKERESSPSSLAMEHKNISTASKTERER